MPFRRDIAPHSGLPLSAKYDRARLGEMAHRGAVSRASVRYPAARSTYILGYNAGKRDTPGIASRMKSWTLGFGSARPPSYLYPDTQASATNHSERELTLVSSDFLVRGEIRSRPPPLSFDCCQELEAEQSPAGSKPQSRTSRTLTAGTSRSGLQARNPHAPPR